MLGSVGVCGNIRDIDIYGSCVGKGNFRFFSFVLESLHGEFVIVKVGAVGFFKLLYKEVYNSLVKVVAAQTVVTRGSQNLLYSVAYFND